MLRLASLTSVLITLAVLALAAPASPADPDAPPGAPAHWLPNEAWMHEHWLPYDQRELLRLLRTDVYELQRWLSSEKLTLWQFARRRGLRPRHVLRELVRPWRARGSSRHRMMLARARRTFTQPHLSVHLLFHPFHLGSLNAHWQRIFGVSVARTYAEMYVDGISYLQVGIRHRGSSERVSRDFRCVLRAAARRGVRQQETLPNEARRFLAYQLEQANSWLAWEPPARGR